MRRWWRVGLAATGVAAAAVTVLASPKRHRTSEPLAQLSSIMPLPRHPGAIAIFSPTEDRSDQSVEGRRYLDAPNVGGFREELIRYLSGTPGIRVTFRGSVRILYEAGADISVMGRRLGVMAVLEWNLRRRDSLIDVDVRLVRASDGRDLWSHVYERPIGEVGAIPEEISRSVAGALGFAGADSARPHRGATTDLMAYDYYLRAQHAGSKVEEVNLLSKAIARDSGFALAYAGLAGLHMGMWSGADRGEGVKPLVAKALELDSALAIAHRMAGWIAMWEDRDWTAAERHLSRALALDSSDIWTYHQYANYLAALGRTEEGLAIARRATVIDPFSSLTATEVGLHLYWNRRYDEAIRVLERAQMVDTVWWQKTPMVLGRAYLAVGRFDDAIREFRRAGIQTSEGFEAPALLAHALGRAGRTDEANTLISQYWERARASSARPMDLVAAYLGLADTARALDWVEQIPGDRSSRFYLLSEPIFDPIRNSPRFRQVLEALGLAAAARTSSNLSTSTVTRPFASAVKWH